MVAVEGRGHDLIARGVREQVAGELLDREGVEGLVVVESLDDPVAVGPHRALRVALEAVGVGVAGEVEPLSRHMFAVIGRGQQAVEGLGPGFRGAVGEEGLQVGVGGRQSGQVEGGAAQQRGLGRGAVRGESLGGERSRQESVDRVAAGGDGRHGGFRRNLEGPVSLVFGALLDPAFDEGDLVLGEHLMEFRRGHVIVRVVGAQALHHFAGFRFAGDDGGFAGLTSLAGGLKGIETELTLDLVLVGPVAGEASIREDRADVSVELHLLGGDGERAKEAGGGEAEAGKTHGACGIRQV